MQTLTRADLEVLLEAMESWEHKDDAMMMMDALTSKFSDPGQDPRSSDAIAGRDAIYKKYSAATKTRKDRSVLIRAKLIQLRDQLDVDSILNTAHTTEPGVL